MRDTLLMLHKEKHLWSAVHPGTVEALERLRDSGYRLAVVSNSDGRAEEGLAAAGLRPFFEFVIDSQLVGFEKPDPRIFEVALRQLGVAPAEGAVRWRHLRGRCDRRPPRGDGCDSPGSAGESPGSRCADCGEFRRGSGTDRIHPSTYPLPREWGRE